MLTNMELVRTILPTPDTYAQNMLQLGCEHMEGGTHSERADNDNSNDHSQTAHPYQAKECLYDANTEGYCCSNLKRSCLYTSSRAGSRAQFSSEIAIGSFSET